MSEPSTPTMSVGPALPRKLSRCRPVADPNDPQLKPAQTVIQALYSQKASDCSDGTDHLSVSTDNSLSAPEPTPKRKHEYPNGGKTLAPKKRVVIPRRSPLPSRAKRVVNPGMPDAKRARRTSAVVTAATKQKAKSRQVTEDVHRQKVQAIAEEELQEEGEDSEKSSVVNERHKSVQDSDDSPSQIEDMVEEDSADNSTDMATYKKSYTRKKKLAKGKARAAIDVAKVALKAAQTSGNRPNYDLS